MRTRFSVLLLLLTASPALAQFQPQDVRVVTLPPVTFAAPQNVVVDSGTVTFANTTLAVTNAGTFAVQAAQSGTWNIGSVTTLPAITFASPQAVTGTFWQATQPVSGPVTDAELRASAVPVSLASVPSHAVDVLTLPAIPAGTNNIGDVDIATLPALVAGSAIIGNVRIDQTTPGTTNRVDVGVFPDNEPINVAQMAGVAVSMNTGVRDTGTQRVTIATNDIVPASQSGTWTVQPGNTPNTTAWLASTKTALTFNAPTAASVGVASAQALAANASRKGLIAVNTSNATISCSVAQTAVLNSGVTLEPSAVWNMNEYSFATGAVNCIASAAASNLSLQEMQ